MNRITIAKIILLIVILTVFIEKDNLFNYEIDKIYPKLLILRFSNKKSMNEELGDISNRYEGLSILEGHNFPASFIKKTDRIYNFVKKNKIEYVIGIYNSDSLLHEKLHAKYYFDKKYKQQIDQEWNNIDVNKKNKIITFLKNLGYNDKVLIDEYQAYKYSEKDNFFDYE
jgi:hypothetical protein